MLGQKMACKECDACLRKDKDCGRCKSCVAMPKFGGVGSAKQVCQHKLCSAIKKHAILCSSLDEPSKIRKPFSAKDLFCLEFRKTNNINCRETDELWRQLTCERREAFEKQAKEDARYCTYFVEELHRGGKWLPHFGEFNLRETIARGAGKGGRARGREGRGLQTRSFAAQLLGAWAKQIHEKQTLHQVLGLNKRF